MPTGSGDPAVWSEPAAVFEPDDEHLLERITHTVVVLVADPDPSPVR
jgi:hypothetical protein